MIDKPDPVIRPKQGLWAVMAQKLVAAEHTSAISWQWSSGIGGTPQDVTSRISKRVSA